MSTSGSALPTGTVTMLFTDIEGSTRLLTGLGERYGELLADQRRILREAFAAHAGREIDTQGDAFFAAFTRARQAVEAALQAQLALAAHEWPGGVECRVRMGLHTGEPSVGEDGYHGIGLHRGARIAAAAHGGQVLLSSTTAELIQDDLPAGTGLRDLGERRLKDIDRPERLYQLLAAGLESEFPPLRTVESKRPRRRRVGAAAAVAIAAVAAGAGAFLWLHGSSPPATAAAVPADSVGVFAPASGRLTGRIPVGASPGDVAAGDGSIWVANVDAHTVSRINPAKQLVIQTIPVGNGPAGIAFGGGFVWVTNGLDGTVTQVDPGVDQPVNTIPVGNGPAGVVVDSGDVWVANSDDGTVTRIDARTGKPAGTIAVGQSADGIAAGFGSVWVTSEASGSVTRIAPGSGGLAAVVQTGSGADAVATGAGAVWVANALDGTVSRIDPATDTVRATVPVGDSPSGIAVVDGAVWVSDELGGSVSEIDPRRNVVARTIAVGNRPEGLVVSAGSLFVAVRAAGGGHRGDTLTVLTQRGDLGTVDPALAYGPTESQVAVLTGDGLTGFRRVGGVSGTRLVPDLAVALPAPTDGGRTYSFQLRPGVHYSNGALVRPADFRRAIERTLALARDGAFYAPYYAGIAGARSCLANPKQPCDLSRGIVTEPGSNTVTFHLTAPDPNLLYELALPSAFAVPAATPLHPHGFLPATGPYEIASFSPKLALRLVRNPRFHEWSPAAQPSGFPDVIVERLGGSADARVSAVLHGTADLATDLSSLSSTVLASLRTQHASRLELNPWDITDYVALDTNVAPFDDARARQAFNLAVDRDRLKDLTVGAGLGQVTCQVLPPDVYGYRRYCPYTVGPSGSGTWTAPDLARARQLVRASGTSGQSVELWVQTGLGYDTRAARYLVSVLDSLGYRASFRFSADPYSVEDKLHVQAAVTQWYPDFASPAGTFVPLLTCASYNRVNSENLNFAEFCDRAVDREIARAESLQPTDPGAASRLWIEVDRDLTDAAPWVPFANGVLLEVGSARIGNYQYNPQWGTLLDQLWVR